MASLKDILKNRIIREVIQDVSPANGTKWKALILDTVTLKVVTTVCKMDDMTDQNVFSKAALLFFDNSEVVEQIANRRQPFPDLEAIYLLNPQPESIDMLIADYARGKPPYAAAHLYFISGLPDSLFQKIQRSTPLMNKVKNLKELNVEFIAAENQVFSVDLPLSFSAALNAPTASLLNYELEPVAKRLVSVLATLGEYPYIRYYNPPNAAVAVSTQEKLAGKLAGMVQSELDNLCRIDKSFPPQSHYPRAILLVVDRGVDMITPLLHEFTYQALINDLFLLEDGQKIMQKDGKYAVLDESDPFFLSQRYNHIADVLDFLATSVKRFKEENKAAQYEQAQDGGSSVDQIARMRDVMSAMPMYQEMKSKDLATSETAEGKPAKMVGVDVQGLLSSNKICHSDKVRLLMLYIISQDGLTDSDRQKLFDAARLTLEEVQAITNLSTLGVRLSASLEKRRADVKNPYAVSHLRTTRKKVEAKFDTSRYIPVLKHIIEVRSSKNTIDETVFTWIKEPPRAVISSSPSVTRSNNPANYNYVADASGQGAGVPRTKPSWATRKPTAASGVSDRSDVKTNSSTASLTQSATFAPMPTSDELRRNGPRIIVFMMGGVTYSELRSCHEVLRELGREIFIGSTQIHTPHTFVDLLKTLHRTGPPLPSKFPYVIPEPQQSPPASRSNDRSAPPQQPQGGPKYRDYPAIQSDRYGAAPVDRNASRERLESRQNSRGEISDNYRNGRESGPPHDSRRDHAQQPHQRHDSRGEVRGPAYRSEYRQESPSSSRSNIDNSYREDTRGNGHSSRDDIRRDMEKMSVSDRPSQSASKAEAPPEKEEKKRGWFGKRK
ncbi:Sec1-like protein [Chytridium lagenaria]|nr:Sec1-like protein [Chytridium lagenaria]